MGKLKKRSREEDSNCSDDDHDGLDISNLLGRHEETEVYRRDNHIYFKTDVTIENINKLINLIREFNDKCTSLKLKCKMARITPKPIFLHITSYGGDCYACRLAIDYIKNSPLPIFTIAEGYVMSAAALMYVVGKKRFMTEQTVFLMHQLRGVNGGTYDNMCDELNNSKMLMDQTVKVYKENSTMSSVEIKNQLKKEENFDYKKCHQKGLVDDMYRLNDDELIEKYE
jgi:ATP-dependent protease ClpP protease subunit